MALAININDLLNKQKIESNRIEFKEHVRKISGRQEAERFWNYPYDAIEEVV